MYIIIRFRYTGLRTFFHIKACIHGMLVYFFFAASLFYPIFRFFPFIPFSNSFFFLHTNIFFSRKFSLIFYSMYNRGLYICTDNIQFIRFLFQFPPLDSAFFCSENEALKHSLGTQV
jgi:hypothetical protein